MPVTANRSTRRSRNRKRKLVLFLTGIGLLLAAVVYWAIAAWNRGELDNQKYILLLQLSWAHALFGIGCLGMRQLLGLLEGRRRSRRRKRYEDYRHAYENPSAFEIPEDWEE